MLRVALTGGIATGKSYCLARLAAFGVPVIDADRLAREAVRPGAPALDAVVGRFGAEILAPDGCLDRPRLAAIVFADSDARRDLEAIVHPVVYDGIAAWFHGLAGRAHHPLGVADIPLLFETGHAGRFDAVVVVACEPSRQLQRLVERSGMRAEEARRRLAAQWPIAEKITRADYVIRTDGTFEETDRQVDEVYASLRLRSG